MSTGTGWEVQGLVAPRRVVPALAAAVAAGAAWRVLPPLLTQQRWMRTNHRGRPVTLTGGPTLVAGLLAGALTLPGGPSRRAAVAVLVFAAGAGLYDDLAGDPGVKGLRGHARALAAGAVTSGTAKVALVGSGSLVAARLVSPQGRRAETAVLVAAAANLGNLLDLRPGRCLKVALALALPTVLWAAPGPAALAAVALGAGASVLPVDLGERAMLGDTGANAVGGLLGLAAARTGTRPRRLVLAGVLALTAVGELVGISRVVDAVPVLRWWDRLGRTA